MGVIAQTLSVAPSSELDLMGSFSSSRASERCRCMVADVKMYRRRPGAR